ncbi:MAG: mercuric transport protein [Methylococcaceae bacterium]|nr:MAG: mercuric transport protein [Methylococcaceae bacterium]
MSEKITVPLIGGFLAGIGASLCCVAPLVLLLFGFGGVWVSYLTALEPYRPIFILIAIALLIFVYFQLYKSTTAQQCDKNVVCAELSTQRLYKVLFWSVVTMVIISIASPYLISFVYG